MRKSTWIIVCFLLTGVSILCAEENATGIGDSNTFALDTTDTGTGGDSGVGDSNGFALDTTDTGTGGDSGVGDSNTFALDTTDTGTGGDSGVGDSNGFCLRYHRYWYRR